MFTVIKFDDYRKDIMIQCLGYCTDFEKTRSIMFAHAVNAHSSRGGDNDLQTYVVMERPETTEYVYMKHDKRKWQYRPVVIHATAPLTIKQFTKTCLGGKGIKGANPDDIVTQEWLNQNMSVIAERFWYCDELDDEDEDEDEDDEDSKIDRKGNKVPKIEVTFYCSIYAICEICEFNEIS